MSANHYLLTAKTCSKLTEKYLVVSENELSSIDTSIYYVDGPKDLLDALIEKAEKIENLVIPHVRWSIMRDGHKPLGTFNGTLVDGEFYKIVEYGNFSSYWRYKRTLLTEASDESIREFKNAEFANTLNKICNTLFTDLDSEDYNSPDAIHVNMDKDYLDLPPKTESSEENVETKDELEVEEEKTIFDEYEDPFEDSPTCREDSHSEDKSQSSEQSEEKEMELVEIPIGVSHLFIQYPADASKHMLNTIAADIREEIVNWKRSIPELNSIKISKLWVTTRKTVTLIEFTIKSTSKEVEVEYIPLYNEEGKVYTIHLPVLFALVNDKLIKGEKMEKETIKLDEVSSYNDPRPQHVGVECENVSIPYEAKPDRDMRNNIVLGDILEPDTPISSGQTGLVGLSATEDKMGPILDRIKMVPDAILSYKATTGKRYMVIPDIERVIGEFNLDAQQSTRLQNSIFTIAKKFKTINEFQGEINQENILELILNFEKFGSYHRIDVQRPIDLDRLLFFVNSFISKEFMDNNFFKDNINTDNDEGLVTAASLIVFTYIDQNVPSISIKDLMAQLTDIGLSPDNVQLMLAAAGFPEQMLFNSIKLKNSSSAMRVLFHKDKTIATEDDFLNVARRKAGFDEAEKLIKEYYKDNDTRFVDVVLRNKASNQAIECIRARCVSIYNHHNAHNKK